MSKPSIRPAPGRTLTITGPARIQGPITLGNIIVDGSVEIPAGQTLVVVSRA